MIKNNFVEKKLKYLVDNTHHYPIGDGDHGSISPDLYTNHGIPYIRVQNLTFKGDIDFEGITYISEETHKNNLKSKLVENDILIAKTGATVGKLCLLPGTFKEYNTTSSVGKITLDKNKLLPKFLIYFFQAGFMQDLIKKISYQKSAQPGFNIDDLKEFKISFPDKHSQDLIVKYLDKRTSTIDSLIEKIEKKIELLKEQKNSLINRYITKGLSPNVEMKDSGIEWIGEIPSHWEIIKLKYLFEIKTGRDPSNIYSENGLYDVLGTGGIIGKTTQIMFNEPSLILGRKGTIDKPFIQRTPFWISDVVYYTKSTSYITPLYLWFLFTQIDFSFYSYGSTLPSMGKDDYENMKFPIPPKNEISEIEKFLENGLKNIKKIIFKNSKKIDLLQEYRQSLISSVVTGKIEITEDMI